MIVGWLVIDSKITLWIHNTKAPFGTLVELAPSSNAEERNQTSQAQ